MRKVLFLVLSLFAFLIFERVQPTYAATTYGEGHYYSDPGHSGLNVSNLYYVQSSSNSKIDDEYPNVAILTKDQKNQKGVIYSKRKVDLSKAFTLTGSFYTGPGANGIQPLDKQGDGVAFVLQNDPSGFNSYGSSGEGIGYEAGNAGSYYILNAIAFELDTYYNNGDAAVGTNDKDVLKDCQHEAWVLPQNRKHHDTQFFQNNTLYGTEWRDYKIQYTPNSTGGAVIQGSYGGKTSIYTIDSVQKTFGTTGKVIWGLTGSTGGAYEVNALRVQNIYPSPSIIATKSVYDAQKNDIDDQKVVTGQTITYRLSATNQGTDSASSVTFTDKLPAGADYVPDSATFIDQKGQRTQYPVELKNGVLSCTVTNTGLPVIDINQTASLEFKEKVNGSTNKISNEGTIIADYYTYSTNEVNNYLESATPKIEKQVRNITKDKDIPYTTSTAAYPGDDLQYRVQIHADKRLPMQNVILKDLLPAQFKATDASIKLVTDGSGTAAHKVSLDQLTNLDVNKALGSDAGAVKNNDNSYLELTIDGAVPNNALETTKTSELPLKFSNTAMITASSYGNNQGHGWASNPATVLLQGLKSKIIKAVKLSNTDDSHYTTALPVTVGDDLTYKVTIKPDNKHLADLNHVQLKDDFDGKLGTDLTLKDVTVHYFDADNHEITKEEEKLTPNTQNIIHLTHPIVVDGHAEVIYNITVSQSASEDTVPNTAVITQDSYGPNNPDNKRDGWFSNPATIKISSIGKVIFRYIDRKSNMKNPAQIADTVTVSGPIGKKVSAINAEPIRPKHIKGWTVIDVTQTADLTNATFFQAEKLNPIIAKQDQVITYRYEKAMISLSAPETWNFGKYLNTQRDAIYYLPATRNTANQKVPSGVNVEDYFGTDSWTLSVQQTGQFKSQADPKSHDPALRHVHELTGAQLQFNNALLKKIAAHEAGTAKDVVNNLSHFTLEPAAKQSTTVVTYSKKGHFDQHVATDSDGQKYDDPGWNVWRYQFGRQQQADYSVGLHVPATTKRYKTHYQADLTWTLTIAP
ncbi:DUF11 domain-containing protein [Lactobacillus curvatus]|nr:DUF11 domain-containing protein [Latilactobacillus curvatus]MSE24311.1 DUF11 domain-containing protein [Latilactobacillus curvatus]